jgi:hypothetical protein
MLTAPRIVRMERAGAALFADHLAHVGAGHAQAQGGGLTVDLFLNTDFVGDIHQSACDLGDHLAHIVGSIRGLHHSCRRPAARGGSESRLNCLYG